jgi:aspartokinase
MIAFGTLLQKRKYIRKHIRENDSIKNCLDHVEYYRTNHKTFVIISSPYSKTDTPVYLSQGWKKINQLYNRDATTYLKEIPARYLADKKLQTQMKSNTKSCKTSS